MSLLQKNKGKEGKARQGKAREKEKGKRKTSSGMECTATIAEENLTA